MMRWLRLSASGQTNILKNGVQARKQEWCKPCETHGHAFDENPRSAQCVMSPLSSKADMCAAKTECLLRANSGHRSFIRSACQPRRPGPAEAVQFIEPASIALCNASALAPIPEINPGSRERRLGHDDD